MADESAPAGLAKALAAFQASLPPVGKNASATVQGGRQHRYGDLAAISKVAMASLGRHGLAFIAKPTMHPEHGLVLSYALLHESGEAERGLYPLPQQGSPQAIGSAITYARRYCLCAVTGVAPDDDDDGAAAEQEHRKRADGLPVNADGSLSRSRTTDAQKDAAGVMTAGQLAEHTALGGGHPNERKTPAAERDNVTRIKPEPGFTVWTDAQAHEALARQDTGDAWLDQPAAPLDVPTEDKPGSIGPAQRRAIMAAFGKDADREARLAKLSAWTGREITSTNDLSFLEAKRILGLMARASESGKVSRG